ncbi:MAG: hypothetical protein ACTSQS_15690 [Promethearchaeota archaeon]
MQLPLYLGEIILQYLYRQTEQGKEEAKKGWIKKAEGRKYFTKILLTESGIREAERVSMTIKKLFALLYSNLNGDTDPQDDLTNNLNNIREVLESFSDDCLPEIRQKLRDELEDLPLYPQQLESLASELASSIADIIYSKIEGIIDILNENIFVKLNLPGFI